MAFSLLLTNNLLVIPLIYHVKAGKTTLMDVLALRKSSGEITGEVRLNGHLQESKSFRRCTGYVEQFDTQTPQLTIRETVAFSAKMRLDENDPAVTAESIESFVDQTLRMLELSAIQHYLVGSDLAGGLSFEQKKRLSIAVELAANPSIIFLDGEFNLFSLLITIGQSIDIELVVISFSRQCLLLSTIRNSLVAPPFS